jgi:type II secretory pathway component PulJ
MLRPHDDQAHALAVNDDMARQRGLEGRQEALARALRIEAADALQALAHRGNAKRHQRLGIAGDGRLERDWRRDQACFQFKVSPPRSGLSSASPNGTLAGSS